VSEFNCRRFSGEKNSVGGNVNSRRGRASLFPSSAHCVDDDDDDENFALNSDTPCNLSDATMDLDDDAHVVGLAWKASTTMRIEYANWNHRRSMANVMAPSRTGRRLPRPAPRPSSTARLSCSTQVYLRTIHVVTFDISRIIFFSFDRCDTDYFSLIGDYFPSECKPNARPNAWLALLFSNPPSKREWPLFFHVSTLAKGNA
jgi:hypothetical protein